MTTYSLSPDSPITSSRDIGEYCHIIEKEMAQQREDDGNVYRQLEQKERDLMLAAELGKALLDRNQELENSNEQMMDEYTRKLEVLEQEKYELHLRLENVEAEYDSTVKELQYDINQLRGELRKVHRQSSCSREFDKEAKIDELTKENKLLQDQLMQAVHSCDELSTQKGKLEDQVASHRTSLHEHVSHIDMLREEITDLRERKNELERKILDLENERDALAAHLEESQERILKLERQRREQEQTLDNQGKELCELRESNTQLQVDLTEAQKSIHPYPEATDTLFAELTQVSSSRSSQSDQMHETPYSEVQGANGAEMMDEEDIECDDDMVEQGGYYHTTFMTDSQFLTQFQGIPDNDYMGVTLHDELADAFKQISRMCKDIREKSDNRQSTISLASQASGMSEDDETLTYQAGSLFEVLQDLKSLMTDIVAFQDMSSEACEKKDEEIGRLEKELGMSQQHLNQVQENLQQKNQQLKTKEDELAKLTEKLNFQREEITKLIAERDRLQNELQLHQSKAHDRRKEGSRSRLSSNRSRPEASKASAAARSPKR